MYDSVIIGAGPAGLNASIYASRYKLNHIIIGKDLGGQITKASNIENWAGIKSISGADLMKNFVEHAEHLGGKIIQKEVEKVSKNGEIFEVKIKDSDEKFEAKSVILCLGMKPRKLEVDGEERLAGKGVSYCATCDAMFFKGKKVAIVGSGDSAAMASLHLGEFAEKVFIFYREGELHFEPAWMEKIKASDKIEMIECSRIVEIAGENKVEKIAYEQNGEKKETGVDGVFVLVGSVPETLIIENLNIEVDDQGYIVAKDDQSTSLSGAYAAGDITTQSNKLRQVITAAAEGAIAASSAYKSLKLKE